MSGENAPVSQGQIRKDEREAGSFAEPGWTDPEFWQGVISSWQWGSGQTGRNNQKRPEKIIKSWLTEGTAV